ncbi:MAG: hypothetical protein V4572_00240 [Bacteroidota bacterium]
MNISQNKDSHLNEDFVNIQKILWHEIGHLIIDIKKTDTIENLHLSKINISFSHDKYFNWSGFVQVLPEFSKDDIVSQTEIFITYLISIVSGCAFETIFKKTILKDEGFNFNVCFCPKETCIGQTDYYKYNEIFSFFLDKYLLRGSKEVCELILGKVVSVFIEELCTFGDFYKQIDKVIFEISQEIHIEFKNTEKEFSFDIQNECLIEFRETINELMNKYKFRHFLDDFIANIANELDEIITPSA